MSTAEAVPKSEGRLVLWRLVRVEEAFVGMAAECSWYCWQFVVVGDDLGVSAVRETGCISAFGGHRGAAIREVSFSEIGCAWRAVLFGMSRAIRGGIRVYGILRLCVPYGTIEGAWISC